MDNTTDLQSLVNREMFPEPISIHAADIVLSQQVINTVSNTITSMDVLVTHVPINGNILDLSIGMPGTGPATIYGQIIIGVALQPLDSMPGHFCFNSHTDHQVVIKRSLISSLLQRVRAGNVNQENPLNEIAIMEKMLQLSAMNNCAFDTIFPHNMSLDIAATDGSSLLTMLPRMKNSMDLYDYCFMNTVTRSARLRLTSRARMGEVKRIMRDILTGVSSLHNCHIAHRDLSLENILVSVTTSEDRISATIDDIKIIDFGMAVYHPPDPTSISSPKYSTPFYGKRAYTPPECHYQAEVTSLDPRTADIWACGIIIYVLCFNKPLFEPTANHVGDTTGNFSMLYRDPDHDVRRMLYMALPRAVCLADPNLVDLLVGMLQIDPTRRLTAEEALVHPWLRVR